MGRAGLERMTEGYEDVRVSRTIAQSRRHWAEWF
jgi:hypothetical protein